MKICMTLHKIWLEVQFLYYHAGLGWRQLAIVLKNIIYKNIRLIICCQAVVMLRIYLEYMRLTFVKKLRIPEVETIKTMGRQRGQYCHPFICIIVLYIYSYKNI